MKKMPTITAKEKAKFLEKTEAGEYVQKLLETVTDQVLSEEAIAGQGAGATLTAILKAIWTKASTVDGVASIKVGSDSAQAKTGNVVITLADFGTVAITAEQVALITTNKNGLASLKNDVEMNYANLNCHRATTPLATSGTSPRRIPNLSGKEASGRNLGRQLTYLPTLPRHGSPSR